MGLLSRRVERSELKPGDHIYTWRAAYAYSHHGTYAPRWLNQLFQLTKHLAAGHLLPSIEPNLLAALSFCVPAFLQLCSTSCSCFSA